MQKTTKSMSIKVMTFCSVSIALAVITNLVSIYRFPFGGSVTLFSMLVIVLPAWLFGCRTGMLCGLVYGLLQFMLEPYMVSVPQFLLDYIFAFSVMGVAGVFKDSKKGLLKGYILAILCRWVIATLAGLAWVRAGFSAWSGWAPLPYSAAYNGAYIFTEGIITILILLTPQLDNAMSYIKKMALK